MRIEESALLVLPLLDTTKAVVDMFAPEEMPLCALQKRSHLEDNDIDVMG